MDASGNVTAVGAGTATITVYCPAGNTYGEASATVTVIVSEPAHVHQWVQQTTLVHHDAVTHTEKVEVTPAWDEEKVTYVCSGCGQSFDTKEACQQHIDEAKAAAGSGSGSSSSSSSGSSSSSPCASASVQEKKETIHHDAVYEDKVVVDKEAWDETVVTGYVCSGCGATKGPNDP